MENQQLRKLQLYQLEILKEIDRICTKHNINYYISWGSLLGAVRHKGFIPWDDDIDISLFWDDYLKFIHVCQNELSDKFFLQNVSTEKNYFRTWSKVRINDTTSMDKILSFMKGVHWGICIDVFPILPIPEKKTQQIYQRICIDLYKILCFEPLLVAMIKDNKKLKFYQRAILYIPYMGISIIPETIKNKFKKYLVDKFSNIKDTETSLCGEALSMNYDKSIIPASVYGTPVRLEFEGHLFNAPQQYVEFLTKFYGDYMKLPPESERQGHGDTIISFDYQAHKD